MSVRKSLPPDFAAHSRILVLQFTSSPATSYSYNRNAIHKSHVLCNPADRLFPLLYLYPPRLERVLAGSSSKTSEAAPMNNKFPLWLLLAIISTTSLVYAKPKIINNPDNYTATRIQGYWIFDEEISDALGAEGEPHELEFRLDDNVIDLIPSRFHHFLETQKIYAAGYADIPHSHREIAHSIFLLVERHGAPALLLFYDHHKEKYGDATSAYIHLISGSHPEKDMLFLGGDVAGDAFLGFRRKK